MHSIRAANRTEVSVSYLGHSPNELNFSASIKKVDQPASSRMVVHSLDFSIFSEYDHASPSNLFVLRNIVELPFHNLSQFRDTFLKEFT